VTMSIEPWNIFVGAQRLSPPAAAPQAIPR
jgi:hypothetical protein